MTTTTLHLPPDHGEARNQAILDYVFQGQAEINWAPLILSNGQQTVALWVFADALKIGGVRVNMQASIQQQVADLLNCSLLTARLMDHMYDARVATILPKPRAITMTTKAMFDHSGDVQKQIPTDYQSGILATVGKTWVIDNDLGHLTPGTAMNYGWHFEGATSNGIRGELRVTGSGRLIQGRGTFHDKNHSDYSQICVLVSQQAYLNNQETTFAAIAQNPATCDLVNHSGILQVLRQPTVAARHERVAHLKDPHSGQGPTI